MLYCTVDIHVSRRYYTQIPFVNIVFCYVQQRYLHNRTGYGRVLRKKLNETERNIAVGFPVLRYLLIYLSFLDPDEPLIFIRPTIYRVQRCLFLQNKEPGECVA